MNIRSILKCAFGAAGVIPSGKEAKEIQEERTRTHLDSIPIWNPRTLFDDVDCMEKEYLFVGGGYSRESFLDMVQKETGHALVYSPRHLVQKGHFFDLLFVKIGDKNVTGISELYKRFPGDFKKLPDCMNVAG